MKVSVLGVQQAVVLGSLLHSDVRELPLVLGEVLEVDVHCLEPILSD